MVPQRTHHGITRIAIVLAHEVEIRPALEIDQVSRMNDIIYMLSGPCKRITQGLLLQPSECARAVLGPHT